MILKDLDQRRYIIRLIVSGLLSILGGLMGGFATTVMWGSTASAFLVGLYFGSFPGFVMFIIVFYEQHANR